MRADGTPIFIAEVSSNHAQDLGRCLAFVDAAAKIGCDAVKFQLFKIDRMFAPEILARSEKHRARKAWELPLKFLAPIAMRCREQGVAFYCTPFYLEAVEELRPFVSAFKIASYELLHDALLARVAATGLPMIVSTGMATIPEIQHAVSVIRNAGPCPLTLLHTVSAYPTPANEANLSAMRTIRQETGVPCGWSDHTVSPAVIMRAALHWRAPAIEFHLDLDASGAEYAGGHCWLPEQMAPLIRLIRDSAVADGHGVKAATPAELPDRDWRADPHDGMRPFRHVRRAWAVGGSIAAAE